jgi:hypothetical protein
MEANTPSEEKTQASVALNPALLETPAHRKNRKARPTIQERFEKFHAENPHIYHYFVLYARQAKAAGYEHYGCHAIMQRVRWHMEIETRSDDGFKINNDFSSRYARRIMEQEPDLKCFFVTRRLEVL